MLAIHGVVRGLGFRISRENAVLRLAPKYIGAEDRCLSIANRIIELIEVYIKIYKERKFPFVPRRVDTSRR